MQKQSKTALRAAIITMSFTQMATNGIAPILELIGQTFPEASATSVQFLMTFPSIFVVIFSLLSAVLASRFSKKSLVLTGLSLVAMGGIGAWQIHSSITVLLVWAAFIGIGSGIAAPIAPALVSALFDGGERQSMLGIQNASANIGSMLMTFLGGFLAVAGWQYGYLVYLVAIPGMVCTILGVPRGKKAAGRQIEAQQKTPFKLVVIREMIIAFFFLMIFSAIPANLAMQISERGIGGPALAGTMSTLYLLSGTLVGLSYGKIAPILKDKTIPVGALCLAAGALLIGFAQGTAIMAVGCLVAGASISFVMPGCMSATAKMPGHETMGSALIMCSGNVGVFLAPLLTSLTAVVRASTLTMYRFQTFALVGALLAVAVFMTKDRKKN